MHFWGLQKITKKKKKKDFREKSPNLANQSFAVASRVCVFISSSFRLGSLLILSNDRVLNKSNFWGIILIKHKKLPLVFRIFLGHGI